MSSTPNPGSPEGPRQDSDVEAGHRDIAKHGKILVPTTELSGHQKFYLFGLDGIGAMLLSGGINFAIAYGMYTSQDTQKNPIRLFELPNTLAGDAAVTIIVQCIITWFIELVLVERDLKHGGVHPIGFVTEPSGRFLRWLLLLGPETETESKTNVRLFKFVFNQALRALLIAVASFILLWGPSVGILTTVGEKRGGDWYFQKQWAPEIFKGLLGGILALLTTPPMAAFWLIRAGWLAKRDDGVAPI